MKLIAKMWPAMAIIASLSADPAYSQQSSTQIERAKAFFSTAGVPGDRWVEGETMVPHVAPGKHHKATLLYYPGTEELQPDEVRVIFMGSTYYPSQSQSGMNILVQLGNGDNLVFDFGIGSLRNYGSMRIPSNTINHIFFTHLHMDHMGDLPYFTMFRPIQGGWTPLHIYGPSGSEERYGIGHFIKHMMEMTAWHQDSFHGWPIGKGYDTVVHEFDFMKAGEVIYDRNGAKVMHWSAAPLPASVRWSWRRLRNKRPSRLSSTLLVPRTSVLSIMI